MSKKHRVRNLSELTLSALANTTVSAVGYSIAKENIETNFNLTELDLSLVMVEINSYLEENGATNTIYQELLHLILSSDHLQASIRFVCLQMLLNDNIQCLVTDIFPFPYYEKILQVIAMQGKGLRYLNLKGIWLKEDNMNFMLSIIKNLQNLYKLVIPYIATDDLLKHIEIYQKKLQYLDISGETDITDYGIEYLCTSLSSQHLTVVDIGTLGEENVCHTDIAALLTRIVNLKSIGNYSFVGKSLMYIRKNIDPNFISKLQYIHDTETTYNSLDAICKSCPDLKLIYLDSPEPNILHMLATLKNLQRLKLYKFNCKEIYTLFESIGRQLNHVTLIKGKSIMDIENIVKHCPNLIDLDFYMMDGLTYTANYSFNQLQGLEILNSPLSATSLNNFICNTHRTLKRLAVDSVAFTDADMAW